MERFKNTNTDYITVKELLEKLKHFNENDYVRLASVKDYYGTNFKVLLNVCNSKKNSFYKIGTTVLEDTQIKYS